jgi:hypothetical protein
VEADVDEAALAALVEQLSDPDDERREAAFKELARYGARRLRTPSSGSPPTSRPTRATGLRSLMRTQVQPTLGA